MRKALMAILFGALQGCVISASNFIRNESDSELVVSVQQERRDLGWPRKEAKTLAVPSHNICHLSHDIFYDTFFYISSPSNGRSTNLGALTNESYVYSVTDTGGKQVVTMTEADSKTKRLFESKRDHCVEDEAK
ncbi:MAG: hypothetical protein OJF47_002412 [Nitrospira sp.]|jgi:hypothetical protein|nr:MAG: hypothetical protein OJF47_002412 [Nitrospira sp.]